MLRGLLFGVAAATVLASVAAARRTDSAYDRFMGATDAYDVMITNADDQGTAVFDPDEVAALPTVRDAIPLQYGYIDVGQGEAAIADASGRLGRDINRFKIIEGRTFDPDHTDEAVVSFAIADRYDLEVGDRLSLFGAPDADRDSIRIVGIEASPGEFPPHFPGAGIAHLSPAMASDLEDGSPLAVMVRLDHGAADIPEFLDSLGELADGQVAAFRTQADNSAEATRSIHLQAVAFWILAAVLAATALALIAQLEARSTHAEADDFPALGSLGVSRPQRAGMALLGRLTVAATAGATSLIVAWALSPLTPIGLAELAEPDPGIRFDAPVLLGGALVLFVLIPVLALPAIWADLRRGDAAIGGMVAAERSRRPSLAVRTATAANAPPSMEAGVRLALEPGGGRDSVPVRSTLLGVTLAIVVLAAAVTFAASLNHLLDTPRLYGLVWDTQLTTYGSGPSLRGEVAQQLRQDPRVEGVAVGETGVTGEIGNVSATVSYLDAPHDADLPPAIRGRPPKADDEIGLGARTAEKIGVSVGDVVPVAVEGIPPTEYRVSGILVLPSSQGNRLGEGGLLTADGVLRLGATEDQLTSDLFVRLAPGTDAEEIAATLPHGENDIFVLAFDPPSDVVNFGRVDALPAILGGLLALLAAGTLAHTLLSAARRRRRELAVLKTLGFVSRQVRGALWWQSLTLVTIALVVGVPAGVVAGRAAWTLLADQLGVVPEPVIPIGPLLLLIPAAMAVALLVAVVPGRIAARTPPASVLRTG